MKRKHSWLLGLLVVALLVAACGPDMATPTPAAKPDEGDGSQATAPARGELPVDADDWHVLGSPDAQVTIIEYSDFQ
jgi:protein-disulfide isomerase